MCQEDLVQRQLDAYNRRDLDAFANCYSEDATIRHADGRVLMAGRDEIRTRYGQLFSENPDLRAEVLHRTQVGDWIVDEEQVDLQHLRVHAMVGYLVRSDLIQSVVMIRSDL